MQPGCWADIVSASWGFRVSSDAGPETPATQGQLSELVATITAFCAVVVGFLL